MDDYTLASNQRNERAGGSMEDLTKAEGGSYQSASEARIQRLNDRYREDDNKMGTDERIQNDGIDGFGSFTGSGSGLPAGYGPEEYTICVDGAPVLRNFLTDNPD